MNKLTPNIDMKQSLMWIRNIIIVVNDTKSWNEENRSEKFTIIDKPIGFIVSRRIYDKLDLQNWS
jgi:hypothetical protein